jgi:hypothetical protein
MDNELRHHGVMGMQWGKGTISEDSLEHYGKTGMKWGRRGRGLTANRQDAFNKRDLNRLNNGGHVSVGFTKKRQAAYDKRDKQSIEKSIEKRDKQISIRKLGNGKTLSQNLLKDLKTVALSQVAGAVLIKTGHLQAGVLLGTFGTYCGVGHAIGSTIAAGVNKKNNY